MNMAQRTGDWFGPAHCLMVHMTQVITAMIGRITLHQIPALMVQTIQIRTGLISQRLMFAIIPMHFTVSSNK